jgi:hypothetical protein
MLNFYPDFTLVPGQRGDTAIRRLLATVPDQLVFRGRTQKSKTPAPTSPPSTPTTLEAHPAAITVPANVGQELLDVVEVTDPRCGVTAHRFRVQNIITEYDRTRGRYDQTIALGAP